MTKIKAFKKSPEGKQIKDNINFVKLSEQKSKGDTK